MPKKTKKIEQLSEELNSLSKEIKSLNDSAKIGARDVASVTKSLKNAKKVSKAAKAAGDKVTDGDVNRLKESISREKQLSKIVQNLSGSLKKSDVNAIAKTMTYGKELGKISRMLSGKIGAREVAALNKALVNANEVKRIANSLARKLGPKELKILSNSVKYTKDKVSIDSPSALAGDKNVTTLIEKLNLLLASDKKREQLAIKKDTRFEELERKREKEVSPEAKKEDIKEQNDSFSMLMGGAGLIGIAGLLYYFKDDIKGAFEEGAKKFSLKNIIVDTFGDIADTFKQYIGPETAAGARILLGKTVGRPVAGAMAVTSAAADATRALKEGDADTYGSGQFATAVGAAAGGEAEDPALFRALEKGITGSAIGAGLGMLTDVLITNKLLKILPKSIKRKIKGTSPFTKLGKGLGGLIGVYTGFQGPEESTKDVDESIEPFDKSIRSLNELRKFLTTESVLDARARLTSEKRGIERQLKFQTQELLDESRFGNMLGAVGPNPITEEAMINFYDKRNRLQNRLKEIDKEYADLIPKAQSDTEEVRRKMDEIRNQPFDQWREQFYGKKPQPRQTLMGPIGATAERANSFDAYAAQLFSAESGGNAYATPAMGTARGLGQFTEGTWKSVVTQMGENWSLNDRFDPQKMMAATKFLTEQNREGLASYLNREPSFSELYMAHFMGLEGAKSLIRAKETSPNMSASGMFPQSALYNPSIFYGNTVNDVYDILSRKMGDVGQMQLMDYSQSPKINAEEINKSGSFPTTIIVQNNGDQSTHYHNYGNSGASTIPEGMMPLNVAPNVR